MTINGRTNFVIDQKHGHFRAYDQLAIDPDSCSGRGPKRNARPVKLLINEELKASMLLRNIWGVKPNKKDAMDLAKFIRVQGGISWEEHQPDIYEVLDSLYHGSEVEIR